MSLVLKADCSAADAYVAKTGLNGFATPWWATYVLAMPTTTATTLNGASKNRSAGFHYLADAGNINTDVLVAKPEVAGAGPWDLWGYLSGTFFTGMFSLDTWLTIQIHWDGSTITIRDVDNAADLNSYTFGSTPYELDLGGNDAWHIAGEIYYIKSCVIGSTAGGSDLFSDGFGGGNLSAWSSTHGSVSLVADPFPPSPPSPPPSPSGVYIAFGSPTLSDTPAYVGVNGVQGWNTDRGRQYELDKTQAGTATISVIDTDGTYDPTNPDGPYFGMIGPLAPARILSVNPVTSATEPIFTGFVESWNYVLDTTELWYVLTINFSDGFELLARAEVVPDSSGTTILEADLVDDRITGILADYGWPSDQELIFSGNVHLQQTVYNPQTSLLSVLQDCADAELPNVANLYMDKWGQVAFRGRFARFNPSFYGPRAGGMTPPEGHAVINFWECGDKNAAETFGIAPISEIEWTLDLKNVINAVVCTPNAIAQADIEGQLVIDSGSIAQYGTRVLSISDLLTLDSVANGDGPGQPSRDANDECKIFGQYYVDNYAQPVEMISHIAFNSLDPSDPLGTPLWAFICGIEIGDVVKVWTTNPGGGGFRATQFFVEGIHNVVAPLRGDLFDWTMTLDLSPRAWYSTFSGVTWYTP